MAAASSSEAALNARVAELEQRLEASARSETRRSLALGAKVVGEEVAEYVVVEIVVGAAVALVV